MKGTLLGKGPIHLLLDAGIFLALGGACAAPAPKAVSSPARPEVEPTLDAPTWINQPLSFEKLSSIEAWLAGPGRDYSPALGLEARLQLNEGRLALAQADIQGRTAPKAALESRIQTALAGFEDILREPKATPGNKTRAQVGIKGAQALLAAPTAAGLNLVTRSQWGAAQAKTKQMTPLKGAWSRLTLHHSAESSSSNAGAALADSVETVKSIQQFHQTDPEHLWGDIGYHFLIDSSGRVFEGRELTWQGAHASGNNNLQNLGVCLLGNLSHTPPSSEALKSLEQLLDDLRAKYRIPPGRLFVHSDLVKTDCPGAPLENWLKSYRARKAN